MTQSLQQLTSEPRLYDSDYQQWLETTIQHLREGQYQAIDWDHVLEELESLSKRDKREISSRLTLILMHLLKWVHQPELRPYYGNRWINTIDEQRDQIRRILQDSPSLKSYPPSIFDECYGIARKRATKQTGLPLTTFPGECPFSLEETLNPDYMPASS